MFGCIFDAIEIRMIHISVPGVSESGLAQLQGHLSHVLCSTPHFRWQTCLRLVVVGPADRIERYQREVSHLQLTEDDRSSVEFLEGGTAYGRLLEFICGLHSPVIGETEVLGQFKDACQRFQSELAEPDRDAVIFSAFNQVWRNWAAALLEDAKAVRARYLLDLGSQSYGSLVRRELKSLMGGDVDLLGAGRLALDIVPFIASKYQVTIHCRKLLKAKESLSGTLGPRARVRLEVIRSQSRLGQDNSLDSASEFAGRDSSSKRALVIAAPISSKEVFIWWQSLGRPKFAKILDLRAEWRADKLSAELLAADGESRNLDQVFGQIEVFNARAKERRKVALGEVQNLIRSRAAMAYHRPFGWEDV
jgi:hypothetical protein